MAKAEKAAKAEKKPKKVVELYEGAGLASGPSKGNLASMAHFIGKDATIERRGGDKPGRTTTSIDVTITGADSHGVAFTRTFRGTDRVGFAPWGTIIKIERKLGKGKGDNVDKIPFFGTKSSSTAGILGQWAQVVYSDGLSLGEEYMFIGDVDDYVTSGGLTSHGYDYLMVIPSSALVGLEYKTEDEDEEEEDEDGEE